MPYVELLEKYPLYRKYKIKLDSTLDKVPCPSIHLYCKECKSEQTFNMNNSYYKGDPYSKVQAWRPPTKGIVTLVEYLCAGCQKFQRFYLIKFSENLDYVMKIGQYPPWDISIDKNISKTLKEHEDLYKKGLICESQSYGVGAYAYYRRIVELIIDKLLDSIKDLIDENEKETYEKALAKTKESNIAQEKIAIVKELLPPTLRPGGKNPLSVLHETLSRGIHEKSDEECIDLAENVRNCLDFLINQIISSQASAKKFTKSMKHLLEKKAK